MLVGTQRAMGQEADIEVCVMAAYLEFRGSNINQMIKCRQSYYRPPIRLGLTNQTWRSYRECHICSLSITIVATMATS